jgi:hypothetical protein
MSNHELIIGSGPDAKSCLCLADRQEKYFNKISSLHLEETPLEGASHRATKALAGEVSY